MDSPDMLKRCISIFSILKKSGNPVKKKDIYPVLSTFVDKLQSSLPYQPPSKKLS